MDKFIEIKRLFEAAGNENTAAEMSRYMKNKFVFYGIPSPARKELYKDFLKAEKKTGVIDRDLLDRCYADEHREFQYFVFDYLLAMKKYLTFDDTDMLRRYIVTKPWWDTTDFLCKVIGDIGLRDKRTGVLMLAWAAGDDIWLRRAAILHQLAYKDKTDADLLENIISRCLGTREFFINKAIGWALRNYSKTAPEWVSSFIKDHKEDMDSVSLKEASKYI